MAPHEIEQRTSLLFQSLVRSAQQSKNGTREVTYVTNQFGPKYVTSRLILDSWQPFPSAWALCFQLFFLKQCFGIRILIYFFIYWIKLHDELLMNSWYCQDQVKSDICIKNETYNAGWNPDSVFEKRKSNQSESTLESERKKHDISYSYPLKCKH